MALTSTTLETPILGNYSSEAAAIDAWAQAIVDYYKGATGITTAAVDAELANVKTAMAGLSTTGAVSIQAGFQGIWTAMGAAPASFFATATAITPAPGIATIATVALPSQFIANNAPGVTKATAASNIAGALHTASAGGSWTPPSGPVVPIA